MSAPAAIVAAIVVDQFDEKDRADALARLKISDPSSLAAEVEAAFLDIVGAAKASNVGKLANVTTRAVGVGKQGRALAALLFA